MARIAIVGGGNMGEALLMGFLRAGRAVKDLVVAEKRPDRVRHLSDTHSVLVTSVADAVETTDIVIIAVKPTDVDSVIADVARVVTAASDSSPEHVLVSVAAGVTTGYLEAKLPAGVAVIRAMPNTPARFGAGASVLAKGRFASDEQLDQVRELFAGVGTVDVVREEQLDAVTAISGSGPAYFFLLVEALVDAAVGVGLDRRVATDLAVQTMVGSATMLLERTENDRRSATDASSAAVPDTTAAQLRAEVTSAGGVTAAALRELERGGLRFAVDEAVRAAKTRSEQLIITAE